MPRKLNPPKRFDEVLPHTGVEYSLWLRRGKRVKTCLSMTRRAMSHLDVIAEKGTELTQRRVFRSDVLELLVAYVFSSPERALDFIDFAFGPITPEEEGDKNESEAAEVEPPELVPPDNAQEVSNTTQEVFGR